MQLQETSKQFVEELQVYSRSRLMFPQEVGLLLDQANQQGLDEVFRDAIFHAKFVTKTKEVMDRIGREAEGFDKLSAEFQNSVEQSSSLLKTLVKEAPEEIKQHFVKDFFTLEQLSFTNFLGLLRDLSWVKNWEVDGKPLPLAGIPPVRSRRDQQDDPPSVNRTTAKLHQELASIRLSAGFGIVLLVLLFVVDAPVTVLGVGLSVVVVMVLLYVVLASHALLKKTE